MTDENNRPPGLERDPSFFNDEKNFYGESIKNREQVLDNALSENGGPGYLSPVGNIMRGLKIIGNGIEQAPVADDTIGLVFANRPLLNLSDENVQFSPRFSRFYKARSDTALGYIRGLLDRVTADSYQHPWLDNLQAWIPLITNLAQTSDGFPDLQLEFHTTSPGIRGEVHQIPVGPLEDNGPNTINMSLRNLKGGMIVSLFEYWEHYIPEVRMYDNMMRPHYDALHGNWMEWDTRIYHFLVNQNMVNIEGCAMTIESVPATFPQGGLFTYNRDQNTRRGAGQDTIDISFKGVGSRSNVFEVINSFNLCTEFFNPNMKDELRTKVYRKLTPDQLLDHGNYKAYPYINIDTMEFEWWVPQ